MQWNALNWNVLESLIFFFEIKDHILVIESCVPKDTIL